MTEDITTTDNVFEALDLPYHHKAAEMVEEFRSKLIEKGIPEYFPKLIAAIASALEESAKIATTAERERAASAVVAEAYWRHQGATPDRNTQTSAQIYAQNKAFERRCLLYMVGELGAEYEPLTQTQWMEIKRRATALIEGKWDD